MSNQREAHTPGPWEVEEGHIQRDSGGIRYWQITDGHDAICCNQFCYAGFKSGVNEANARLISAAPDLLEALRGLVPHLDAIACYASTMGEHEPNRLIANTRAAISRATGDV